MNKQTLNSLKCKSLVCFIVILFFSIMHACQTKQYYQILQKNNTAKRDINTSLFILKINNLNTERADCIYNLEFYWLLRELPANLTWWESLYVSMT